MDIPISILLLAIAWSVIGLLGFCCWYGYAEKPSPIALAAMIFFCGPLIWCAWFQIWWEGGDL
jgi:hypothetical protein